MGRRGGIPEPPGAWHSAPPRPLPLRITRAQSPSTVQRLGIFESNSRGKLSAQRYLSVVCARARNVDPVTDEADPLGVFSICLSEYEYVFVNSSTMRRGKCFQEYGVPEVTFNSTSLQSDLCDAVRRTHFRLDRCVLAQQEFYTSESL